MQWVLRMAAILVAAGLADVLVVLFVPRPLHWTIAVAASVPLLTATLVIIPMMLSADKS